jgi:hypothetical protein
MFPLTETEWPKLSFCAGSEAVSFCSSAQVLPLKRYTYAAPQSSPAAQSSEYAPTRTTSPLTATENPK